MAQVFDKDGNLLADIPLSEKQQAILDAGGKVKVQYHTPQMLRGLVENRDGHFFLTKGQRIVSDRPAETTKYDAQNKEVDEIRKKIKQMEEDAAGVKDVEVGLGLK